MNTSEQKMIEEYDTSRGQAAKSRNTDRAERQHRRVFTHDPACYPVIRMSDAEIEEGKRRYVQQLSR